MGRVRPPHDGESLGEYLTAHGITHFSEREVRTARRANVIGLPPRVLWRNIIVPCRLGEALRRLAGCPLVVGNGYRDAEVNATVGGAPRSRHVAFAALDLDVPRSRRPALSAGHYNRLAARVWLEHAEDLDIGLGLYTSGHRIHIDHRPGRGPAYWSRPLVEPVFADVLGCSRAALRRMSRRQMSRQYRRHEGPA